MNTTTRKTTATKVEEPVKEKKTFAPTDEIETSSVTAGELIMIGRKSGRYYRWTGYNDTTPVEYQDLKAEQYVANSPYLYKPLFLINDDEFLGLPENSKIKDFYKSFLRMSDVDEILALDGPSFEKTIKGLPAGIKESFKAIATQKIQNGTLDSLNKIKAIDAILGTDLFNSYVAL